MLTPPQYRKLIKDQLNIVNARVKRWVDWDPDSDIYEAFWEDRKVIIPKPVDNWSFLVALHELGHISTGDRYWSYLCEYNAERWAIRRANEAYGITCQEYEEDAKLYVKKHLIENLIFRHLRVEKIKPYVLEWIGETEESLTFEVMALLVHGHIAPPDYPVNYDYWINQWLKVA